MRGRSQKAGLPRIHNYIVAFRKYPTHPYQIQMVNFRLWLSFSLLLLISCREKENITAAEPPTDHQVIAETTETPVKAEAVQVAEEPVVLDISGLSPEPSTPLKLLMEGTYHKNEVWRGAEEKQWLGLYHEKGQYVLRPATIQVHVVQDPIVDNKGVYSGRQVVAADSNAIFLLTGLKEYAAEVDTALFSRNTLPANKELTLTFKGKDYHIRSFGDSTQASTGEFSYQHYGWKAIGTKKGKKIEQLLAEDEGFVDSIYVLLWAGDLDNDGIPDLLLDLSNHYNVSRYALFLSSKADRGKLYKKVALFETVGC